MNDAMLAALEQFCRLCIADLPDLLSPAPQCLWLDPLVQQCFEPALLALEAERPDLELGHAFERAALSIPAPDTRTWGLGSLFADYTDYTAEQPL